ncbi:Putative von Willebrand factor, type A, AAA+ ATPase domain, midasin, midasin, AAA lid domain 7 [Colletotrichum destructivum]|uniref:Midasin n=1 Tax=Colletotrichum destructivum TaxID=34406 RepID=A0AAX4HXS9_9PEZI|nr:Putative von Willebrand factor, type A, AAA+ ATPase domain, midasin, midasin, AAA lid domain 7 [Colletotrichum destructivum]
MTSIDVSAQRSALLSDAVVLEHLPTEILEVIRNHTASNLLDAVAEAALIPQLTDRIFIHFENVFPDICARWLLNPRNQTSNGPVLASLARILSFAPYLSEFLQHVMKEDLTKTPPQGPQALNLRFPDLTTFTPAQDSDLLRLLLAAWRLVCFDQRTYGILVSPTHMQTLFTHESRAVRYLAIRIFSQLLRAADSKLEALIREHVGTKVAILADFDGLQVDYGFLSLYEDARVKKVAALRRELRDASQSNQIHPVPPQSLTPFVACYGKTILPRPSGPVEKNSSLVLTSTTTQNLETLARLLKNASPILLHGLPGSGKTSLVHEIAKEFGKHSEMVTLHINEQTDAKMLIGLYSTDSKPGTFSWRAGVLTTAVREGRWVLIEDLDRAPNEVISTILPLIERGELLIPSRGERIKAANGFRLFATVRSSRGMHGRETLPNLLGMRFWQLLSVHTPTETELQDIVVGSYPVLHKFAPGILAVYRRLSKPMSGSMPFSSSRGMADRQISLRDLLRWCRRLTATLSAAGCTTGEEPITDTTRNWMFMEAVDCFVAGIPDVQVKQHLIFGIAEEMHMAKELVEYHFDQYIPQLEQSDSQFKIGRAILRKRKERVNKAALAKKPFASTTHAKKLLEQTAVAVNLGEPILLVGETGIGKTTVVQQLADTLGHKLVAINLSQQSEAGDLLGGFKPVNVRSLAVPLKEEFEDLFSATGISTTKNQRYLEQLGKCFAKGQWAKSAKLWREAPKMFKKIIEELTRREREQSQARDEAGQPTKRRKTESKLQTLLELSPRWDQFSRSLDQFEVQLSGGSTAFAFSFVEGNIIKAARNGDWVLLDEINLASPDTLESIADLLTGPVETPSILLSETGEIERIRAHPNFRIFGAMNPATDVGKRDLPIGIRSRFTELYVDSPDKDKNDLITIVKTYLRNSSIKDEAATNDIAALYMNTKSYAERKEIVDGANEVPHFSLRTLTRVLTYVNYIAPFYGIRRSLYEGFSMGFLTLLDRESEKLIMPLIDHHLFGRISNPQSLLSQPPKQPDDGKQYVRFRNKAKDRHYWLAQGGETPKERTDYIITPYVERNLLNLVRATSTRRFPILIQGPTSAGKTSMIEYLANFTGNKFVRINNHEHTDLQEYLGTYVSDSTGRLRFQEGLLVQAMRQGHWIVLDELNLAPTDVLEALNRLLDDNRELLIPETQEVVRPHENFMLFATQNPPGLYGGRKVLSRAFRNRFLELHFDDIPEDELEYILQNRSINTAPSDCKRIVTVYKELSRLRQTSRLFEQKDSFATLRDLFRWALREADTREQIAVNGFMLLAERVRIEEERTAVREVIESVFKVKIDPEVLYTAKSSPILSQLQGMSNNHGVVWTRAMRRLYVLVHTAIRNNEPVLLVGETGCGKTTVCQILGDVLGKELHIVNAHQNTETGDLIGSQRPVRNRGAIADSLKVDLTSLLGALGEDSTGSLDDLLQRYHALPTETLAKVDGPAQEKIALLEAKSKALFEWSDGSLVHAMKAGQFFLLDEISLADDSVLERLNSVLEPQRSLLLAEKGIDNSFVTAADGFQFFATMNPGGDFGKRELSPALRNRFTEIWVPAMSEMDDMLDIVLSKLDPAFKSYGKPVVQFAHWFGQVFRSSSSTAFSIRDILIWVNFINLCGPSSPQFAVAHGAATVFIDSLGANPSALLAMDPKALDSQRQKCLDKLSELLGYDTTAVYRAQPEVTLTEDRLSIGEFGLPREAARSTDPTFAFNAPTTRLNAMRVMRSLQMRKPILLEGSPGVGKTTLVAALARVCGRPLTRINLSDQTDLMDLFGTDMPVEGAEAGNFAWRDAPFLQAMQNGEWVLLDEMNLASQSVLEGLNACLDHRGEVYISELDQVFKRHPDFRLFAAQNPHHQGGGRKGLPSSFVNRFIVVYADVFTAEDLLLIAQHNFPSIPTDVVSGVIQFISRLDHQVAIEKAFGSHGSPWEFNLRDILRWLHLLATTDPLLATGKPDDFLDLIIRQRFRSSSDREEVNKLFAQVFSRDPQTHSLYHDTNAAFSQVGNALLPRNQTSQPFALPGIDIVSRLPEIESLMVCIKQDIPCILSGPSGSGKSVLLEHVAALVGKPLVVFPLNADIDTMDLVGGFEQSDPLREVNASLKELFEGLQTTILTRVPGQVPPEALALLYLLETYRGDTNGLPAITAAVEQVLSEVSRESEIGVLLSNAYTVLQNPLVVSNPRFEWLDGVIVKALETGQWLVLDNANLCNASVLDRLNSLLEPNGFLSINEHCGPNGEPRIIRPHPDFRIFLTVDPRYGELSRAMRNRAAEIHLSERKTHALQEPSSHVHVESSLQRFSTSSRISTSVLSDNDSSDVSNITLENLSLQDLALVDRFSRSVQRGLTDLSSAGLDKYQRSLNEQLGFLDATETAGLREAISQLYAALPGANSGFGSVQVRSFKSWRERGESTDSQPQPLNPLHNASIVRVLHQSKDELPFWLSVSYGFLLEIQRCQVAIATQATRAKATKLASLNRLQRSIVSDRVASVAKDSTVRVSKFLSRTLQIIRTFIQANLTTSHGWQDRARVIRNMLDFWWRTLNLTTENLFEEARFQAHLMHGVESVQTLLSPTTEATNRQLADRYLQTVEEDFTTGFRLTTGLSMEVLWKQIKPLPVMSEETLTKSQEIEQLGKRLDELKWKVKASITDLARAMTTLVKADEIVRSTNSDVTELIQDLTKEIELLESKVGSESSEVKPFFASEFETLRQASLLRSQAIAYFQGLPYSANETDLLVLSSQQTIDQIRLGSFGAKEAQYLTIGLLASQDPATHVWNGKFATSLLSRLNSLHATSLRSLGLLETELPAMGRSVAALAPTIQKNQVAALNAVLKRLITTVFSVHGGEQHEEPVSAIYDQVKREFEGATVTPLQIQQLAARFEGTIPSDWPVHVHQIAQQHLVPAVVALAVSDKIEGTSQPHSEAVSARIVAACSAVAWVEFSVSAIMLYVPDKAFDPQLRPQFEKDVHDELTKGLEHKLSSLLDFETRFTGQKTSLRIQLVQQDIEALGPAPAPTQLLYRPARSELANVQTSFNNVLATILGQDLSAHHTAFALSGSPDAVQVINLVRQNLAHMVDRLANRDHRANHLDAYQDMTRPLVNILGCLQLGLSLSDGLESIEHHIAEKTLMDLTPFIGGNPEHHVLKKFPNRSLEFLDYIGLIASVEGLRNLNASVREALFECVHRFFQEWAKRLEDDRKAEEARTNLYRFKGSFEDEEEMDEQEFNELFPTYDEEQDEKPAIGHQKVRDVSVRLAESHRKVFLEQPTPPEALQEVCKKVGKGVAQELAHKSAVHQGVNSRVLPLALWSVDEQMTALKTNTVGTTYNFYTDSNLPEVRRLIPLVDKVEARFRDLQQVDEIGHMQPLADVRAACEQLLDLTHTEPLAKILPKLEHLHGIVYEWQHGGYAPAIYGAPALYTSLTDTIISWRRLELSTWAKLFDMEAQKCSEDADSWFFIAYQVLIAVPLSLVDSPELKDYAVNLVRELETYFSTAIIGQFSARLRLLRQLQKHLQLLTVDYPSLAVVSDAALNFIDFHSRFEKVAKVAIAKGRAPFEKTMKEVVLLASWKDTNINALRESARKSHLKLFRLVRKFRAVLGQPMKPILEQGIPDDEVPITQITDARDKVLLQAGGRDLFAHLKVDVKAVKACNVALDQWFYQHKRLSNTSKTLHTMVQVAARAHNTPLDATQEILSYVQDLNASIAELRKETPGTLTDENKDQVKNLKTRKRNLFADVLKMMRQMGFRYNLGTEELAKQDSLAVVLARMPASHIQEKENSADDAAEYYFHKVVDIAPKVRASIHEYSEELTGAEMSRSTGFMEGMVAVVLGQHSSLSATRKAIASLDRAIASVASLSSTTIGRNTNGSSPTITVDWMKPILDFGIKVVDIHGKLASVDNQPVLGHLQATLQEVDELSKQWHALASTPQKFTTEQHDSLRKRSLLAEENFKALIPGLGRSDLDFVLKQITSWFSIQTVQGDQEARVDIDTTAQRFNDTVPNLCDTVLVALQEYKKTMAGLPSSSEDSGWLAKASAVRISGLNTLYINAIVSKIEACLAALESVDLEQPKLSALSSSLLAVVLPILQQYASICRRGFAELHSLHAATGFMAHQLARTFVQLAAKGFCSPQEKQGEESGESGKLESGTGLGDGDGAEDISKDIQPDEDLTELAQEPNKEKDGEMEDEKDAVDMADEELEGEMGSVGGDDEEENSDGEGEDGKEENEMEEEVGDVDDLDPTAVDEKMWDGGGDDEAEKDQKGDKAKGQKMDEQMAAEAEANAQESETEDDKQNAEKGDEEMEEEEEEEEEPGAEQEDAKFEDDQVKQDQNVEENDALAMPEEMDFDFDDEGEDAGSEDDELDKLSDVEKDEPQQQQQESDVEDGEEETQRPDEKGPEHEGEEEKEEEEAPEEDLAGEPEVDMEPKAEEEEQPNQPEEPDNRVEPPRDDSNADANAAPSDVKGGGQDQDADKMDVENDFDTNAAQRDDGDAGDGSAEQQTSAGKKGQLSRSDDQAQPTDQDQDDTPETSRQDPFKKLGDALERWHRQQNDIKDPEKQQQEEGEQKQSRDVDAELGAREFQHLEDDETAADAQAMGNASEDQVQPIDEAMAIDEEKEDPQSRVMPDAEDAEMDQDPDKMDTTEAPEVQEKDTGADKDDGRSGVKTRQGAFEREASPTEDEVQRAEEDSEDEQAVEETSTQLSATHISDEQLPLRDFSESLRSWTGFQSKTHPLSLSLTSQLRLILTPSQSTKLSGSYRTGKRLNIKKIIPYIASSYKRDKIWMRRAIPTKRSYQILLCVDDSRSMGESSSGTLALESLVMVSRALTMLEVGQVGVLGFGADTFMAHDFAEPFASHDAGAKVMQHFNFQQDRTDIALLVRRTIDHFRAARLQNPARGGAEDLWQLALILSDGLTPSSQHEPIRRLLREAMEERIMIVFIVMDDTGNKKGDSVLDLKEAKFVKDESGNSRVVIERYLDTFPFQYYLIVHNLEDLPGALAGLLRTWFAEVNS